MWSCWPAEWCRYLGAPQSVSKHFEIECIARRGLLVVASRSTLLRFDADCTLIEDQQLDARDGGLGRVVQGRFPEGPEGGRGPVRLGRQEKAVNMGASVEMLEDFYGKKRMRDPKMATEVTKFRER